MNLYIYTFSMPLISSFAYLIGWASDQGPEHGWCICYHGKLSQSTHRKAPPDRTPKVGIDESPSFDVLSI